MTTLIESLYAWEERRTVRGTTTDYTELERSAWQHARLSAGYRAEARAAKARGDHAEAELYMDEAAEHARLSAGCRAKARAAKAAELYMDEAGSNRK